MQRSLCVRGNCIFLFILLLFCRQAIATPPNILGSYSGTITETETNCGIGGLSPPNPPAGNSVDSETMTLTISSQTGNNFSGTGSQSADPGEVVNITFSGTVDDLGNVSGSWTSKTIESSGTTTATGTFSGTIISGDTFTLSASGTDTSSADNVFCNINISGTLSRVSANLVVNPAITPSSTLTNPLILSTQVDATTSDLGTRIGDVLRKTGGFRRTSTGMLYSTDSGLNAGDFAYPYGVWGSVSYSTFDNDLSSTALDGERYGVLTGIDFSPFDNSVLGIAAGYEYSDIDTTFNLGNQKNDGYTIAPYFGYLFTETWSIDISAGYSSVEADQFRTLPGTTTIVTSDPETERWFGMLNVNGYTTWDRWTFGLTMGTLWAKSEQESFTESDGTFNSETTNKLGQWRVGGEAAYLFTQFEPFARFSYQRDYSATEIFVTSGPQPSNDRDDYMFTWGVRYFSSDSITGNFEWNKRLGRNDFDEDTISLTIRGDF